MKYNILIYYEFVIEAESKEEAKRLADNEITQHYYHPITLEIIYPSILISPKEVT